MRGLCRGLAVSERIKFLCLHDRLHADTARAVLCVCGFEVQGGDWHCTMHRLHDEFRTRVDSEDGYHRLCL